MSDWMEKMGRAALTRAGFHTTWARTATGPVHVYLARGQGELPPVVAFHGINSSVVPYGRVLQRLRPHLRGIIAPDAPGHGFSPTPSGLLTVERLYTGVSDAADALLPRYGGAPIVYGNSLGGALAVRYALDHPDQVSAVVLTSPAGARTPRAEFDQFLARFRMDDRRAAKQFVERLYHSPPLYARLISGHIGRQLDRPHIQQILEAVGPDDHIEGEALRNLQVPILFIWGKGEKLLLPSHRQWYLDHLPPQAEVLEPTGVGHLPHLEDPAGVAAAISDFARRHVGERAA